MNILAIETSCDETAVAVVEMTGDAPRVLSSVISSQIALHAPYGGVVPALAAREHAANIGHVFTSALTEAGVVDPERDIDLVAVTRGPGLGPALLVGTTFARTLAWQWEKPLIGVNHLDGHIHSNWLPQNSSQKPGARIQFPALNLVVSGGHTELVLMRDHGSYETIGETRDDAIGESFDKAARLLDLGYPGGPAVATLALSGNPHAFTLPRPMAASKNFDFSYAGLKTALLYLIRDLTAGNTVLTDAQRADLAASFQEAAVDVLIQKTKLAAFRYEPKSLLLSGGVSANTLLRERITALGKSLGISVHIPEMQYTGDNAAMMAVAGYFAYRQGATTHWDEFTMDANLRLGHNQQ